MTVRRTGDWELARRVLAAGPARVKEALGTAIRQEAHLLRREIVEGITAQAPGGRAFEPLAPTTLAARRLAGFRGTKALLRNSDLRNAIVVIAEGNEAFIGVARTARAPKGTSLMNVASIHEFGAGPFVIPMTPRMRRFLFVLLRRAGVEPRSRGGKVQGAVVVRIPPRPFLRPAFEAFSKGVEERFLRRVARLLRLEAAP